MHIACSLLTVHCSLLTTHCSLLTAHYSLLTTHYPLPTTHYLICYLPRTAHLTLLIAHCSLLTSHCSPPHHQPRITHSSLVTFHWTLQRRYLARTERLQASARPFTVLPGLLLYLLSQLSLLNFVHLLCYFDLLQLLLS